MVIDLVIGAPGVSGVSGVPNYSHSQGNPNILSTLVNLILRISNVLRSDGIRSLFCCFYNIFYIQITNSNCSISNPYIWIRKDTQIHQQHQQHQQHQGHQGHHVYQLPITNYQLPYKARGAQNSMGIQTNDPNPRSNDRICPYDGLFSMVDTNTCPGCWIDPRADDGIPTRTKHLVIAIFLSSFGN